MRARAFTLRNGLPFAAAAAVNRSPVNRGFMRLDGEWISTRDNAPHGTNVKLLFQPLLRLFYRGILTRAAHNTQLVSIFASIRINLNVPFLLKFLREICRSSLSYKLSRCWRHLFRVEEKIVSWIEKLDATTQYF